MSQYDPATNDRRGTCPGCDRRCKVRAPKGGGPRVCCWHRSRQRDIAFGFAAKRCGGTGLVCQEDRKP